MDAPAGWPHPGVGGHLGGVAGPVHTPARIAYAHLELEAGARFQQGVPEGWRATPSASPSPTTALS